MSRDAFLFWSPYSEVVKKVEKCDFIPNIELEACGSIAWDIKSTKKGNPQTKEAHGKRVHQELSEI